MASLRHLGILWVLVLCCLSIISAAPVKSSFQVHVFAVGQADSQLIVFPSGYSILFDLGELAWSGTRVASEVAEKIESILGTKHVDVAVVSHLHLDHIGYAGHGGIWALVEKHGFTFGKLIDRDAGKWKGTGRCNLEEVEEKDIDWSNAGTLSGTAAKWLCWVTDPANSISSIREFAKVGSTTQINPPDTDATVTIVSTDGKGVVDAKGVSIQGDHTAEQRPPSENDYSIGLLIRFGKLDYLSCGDASGEFATSSFDYTYNDVETLIADRVNKKIDVLHVNHHGSGHSTNEYFVKKLSPKVSVCSCGEENQHDHPAQSTIDRITPVSDLYLPQMCHPERDYKDTVFVGGDIVIESADGIKFTIGGFEYTADDASDDVVAPALLTVN